MATIRMALALYDGMTAPLMQMNRALHIVLNSFEATQRASGKAVDSRAILEARGALGKAEAAFRSIEQEIERTDRQQQRFNQSMNEGGMAAEGLLAKIKRITAATGAGLVLKKLVDTSDLMAENRARLSLLIDDGGSVDALEKKVMAAAQRSRAAFTDTAGMVARLGQNARAAFSSNDELIAFAEQVNKLFKIGGASAAEQSAATMQLTQALAAGALRGDELNSILEGAPGIARAIEQYMGIAEGSIKKYAQEGQVTAAVVKNALFAAAEETNAEFAEMPWTWAQVFTVGKNVALQALDPLFNRINALANYIDVLGPAVLGLGLAFLVFQVAAHWTQIAAAAVGVYHAAIGLLSLGYGVLTGNTAAASAAVLFFNSALLANPITWVVMLLAVLIGALYAGVAAYNHHANASVSATGIISGAFGVMVAFVGNLLISLWNQFALAANFIGNVFRDPVAAVKLLFYDMAMDCIGYIASMAQGIETLLNKIPGVEIDITSGLDSIYNQLAAGAAQVKDASGWQEYVQSRDYMGYTDYAKKGYALGKGFADKAKGIFDLTGGLAGEQGAASLDNLYAAAEDTAGNTARMADSMELSEENIAYLREIAEREAINRFTTAEIRIEQHNENHIGSEMDVDGIMDRWCEAFAERMDIEAEGVHI